MDRTARPARIAKRFLLTFGSGFLAAGGCLPDNLWANLLGGSIITGTVEALRNTVLDAMGLSLP